MCVAVPGADLDDIIGNAVTVLVGQGHDSVRAALGDEQDATRRDRHETRPGEALREHRCGIPLRHAQLGAAASSGVEVHAEDRQQLRPEGKYDAEQDGQRGEADERQVAEAAPEARGCRAEPARSRSPRTVP